MTKRALIVGTGIIGASFAYHLAKAGADVRVVDGATVAGGIATPNSWGWINASWGNAPDYFRLRHQSMRMWRALDAEIPGLQVNWCGGLLWDLPEPQLQAYATERRGQGYGARLLDAAEIAKIEPNLKIAPALAVHVPEEGCIEPLHGVEKLLVAAQAYGADVLLGMGIRWLLTDGGRVTGVMTNEGPVEADVVVLAAGVGCRQLLRDVGVGLALDDPPGLLVQSAPSPELLKGLLMAPELHVRQSPEGRLVAGTDFGGADPADNPDAAAQDLFAKLQAFVIGGLNLQFGGYTVGYRPTPRDGVSAIGFVPGFSGLYLCVTHSGITLAPALGAFGATEIMDVGRHEMLANFAPDRILSPV
jgi:glycine/D-amino acid oxidase-like deaminating enzyme